MCLMGRSNQAGVFHIWEDGIQGCEFINYKQELSWNITKDAQKQKDNTKVG